MNKSFMLLDKGNNLQKNATVVVKFNFEQRDYLVYSVDENDTNSQIFVSRLVSNSDGKYFLDNILSDEKGKLNNIVYNIVILLPTEFQKGNTYSVLSENLTSKFGAKLVSGVPGLDVQEYFSNCSVAITSKVLVDTAVKFYDDNLNNTVVPPVLEVPTWTAPAPVTAPTPVNENSIPQNTVTTPVQNVSSVSNLESVNSGNVVVNSQSDNLANQVNAVGNVVSAPSVVTEVASVPTNSNLPNPQAEKLAIVSDPSLGLGVTQPNVAKKQDAGFANTKYIIIGTVCLVIAIAVVVIAYLLINNMK